MLALKIGNNKYNLSKDPFGQSCTRAYNCPNGIRMYKIILKIENYL